MHVFGESDATELTDSLRFNFAALVCCTFIFKIDFIFRRVVS